MIWGLADVAGMHDLIRTPPKDFHCLQGEGGHAYRK